MAEHWRAPKQGERIDGGHALIKSLEMEGVEVIFGLPGGAILPGVRPDHRQPDPPHPRAPRAGRRPHGRGLRPRHRPARRGHGDLAARRPPTSSRRCADAYMDSIPMVVHHRPGADRRRSAPTPSRSATSIGITRSVTKHNELVTPRPGHPPRRPRGVPHRHDRPPRPGAGRHPQGHRRPAEPELGHGVVLADRRRGAAGLPGYQPDHQGPPAR